MPNRYTLLVQHSKIGHIYYCLNILIANMFIFICALNIWKLVIPNENVSALKPKLAFAVEAKLWTAHFKKGEKQLHVKQ